MRRSPAIRSPFDLCCSAQLLCRCVSVENKFVETDRFFQEPETATFALLLPPQFYPFLARKFVHEHRRRALVSSPESAFRFLPRRLESFIFVGVATKFALGSLDPIVQPRQKIGFCDRFPAKTEDDFPNGEFGNPLVLRALKHAARARDFKKFFNVGARFRINAEKKILFEPIQINPVSRLILFHVIERSESGRKNADRFQIGLCDRGRIKGAGASAKCRP